MKTLLVILLFSFLVGCKEKAVKDFPKQVEEICLDGVTYYLYIQSIDSRGGVALAVKVTQEGKIVKCGVQK